MALFKISKGTATNLASNRPNTTEGYCYITTDEHKFYVDLATANNTTNRICLNAANADTVNNLEVQTAVPKNAVFTDTKNTAGSTDTSSKIYLVGATSQAINPQTYSDNQVYVTNGQLDVNAICIGETVLLQYDKASDSLNITFT